MNISVWLILVMMLGLGMAGTSAYFAFSIMRHAQTDGPGPDFSKLSQLSKVSNDAIASLGQQVGDKTSEIVKLQKQHIDLQQELKQTKLRLADAQPEPSSGTVTDKTIIALTKQRDDALQAKAAADLARNSAVAKLVEMEMKTVDLTKLLQQRTNELHDLQQSFAHRPTVINHSEEMQGLLDESMVKIRDLELQIEAHVEEIKHHEQQIEEQEQWIDQQAQKINRLTPSP